MSETIIKIDHVSKEYRLGAIGGGTLRGDLQSWWAKVRGKDDPNLQIGKTAYTGNEKFLALDDISFEVKKGEALGIIGHNGAGKSTLLKLLSRVTAPTKGTIGYNGRIASMLEVGTGFHPELTGRENVYMNGAILGMTRAEISRKFDQIVEFAEMEKFIDTPVKRYSSGMYVKLAFAVAAHLDSEILVMDEVLAVGDMKFQQKCLGKMGDAANNEGRTVLYVSHNMNTIRQLCSRCVVLDHGKVAFDGGVEDGINVYMNSNGDSEKLEYDYSFRSKLAYRSRIVRLNILDVDRPHYSSGDKIHFQMTLYSVNNTQNLRLRFEVRFFEGTPVGTAWSEILPPMNAGENTYDLFFDTKNLTRGKYKVTLVLFKLNEFGTSDDYDLLESAMNFEIDTDGLNIVWNQNSWGHVHLPELTVGNN